MNDLNLTAVMEPRYVLTIQDQSVVVGSDFNLTLQENSAPLKLTLGLQGQKGIQGDVGPQGPVGPAGPAGTDGTDGVSFAFDGTDTFANRNLYDAEVVGWRFLASDTGEIYVRLDPTGWSAPIQLKGDTGPQGPQGIQGVQGPIGPQGNPGADGQGFTVDAYAELVNLGTYDNEAEGFSVVDPVTGLLYIRYSVAGTWTNGIQFVGPEGPTGPIGPAGPTGAPGAAGADGADFAFDAVGTLPEKNLYNAQPEGFTFLDEVNGNFYVRNDATIGAWTNAIPFQGPTGPQGAQGDAGISAYDLAVSQQGFVGSVSDWLTTLTAYGVAVSNGFVGTQADWLIHINAYGIAVQNGYLGTQAQWLQDMTAYGIAVLNGYAGTEPEWLIHINAYGRALDNGFVGTELEWLDSLTAYGVAQSNGYAGTKAAWLTSLTAYGVAVDNGFVGTEPEWLTHISAYGVAVQNGFVGTELQWLDSLVGPIGPQGIQGLKGDTGQSLIPDAIDLFANRALYDTELEGFVFMASDTGLIYFRETVFNGTWSVGVPFRGPDGLPGDVTTRSLINTATYTVLNTDLQTGREIKKVDHAVGCAITVPAGLTNQEPCTFIQTNVGQITFAGAVGVTILSADSALLSRVQGSFVTLLPDGDTADLYYLTGDIVA
ncbi:structural protein [Roseovarius Plymouth podovirus 1]|uniref:Structural protein n=1 Tax=Roseovarius Plymouth podovirus 1 TaxID=926474 RepID=K4Q595_9CAUD|nr:virion structural protein [Roseovarius Plymouth podovirus 1]CBX87962.1 structural protein [Roseovarius Plymouth podovirus 1]